MKRTTIKKAVVLATLSSMFVLGCELIVDFDRTRIPVEGTDATTADVVTPANDAATTTDASDAAATDAADAAVSDASSDAEADADATP